MFFLVRYFRKKYSYVCYFLLSYMETSTLSQKYPLYVLNHSSKTHISATRNSIKISLAKRKSVVIICVKTAIYSGHMCKFHCFFLLKNIELVWGTKHHYVYCCMMHIKSVKTPYLCYAWSDNSEKYVLQNSNLLCVSQDSCLTLEIVKLLWTTNHLFFNVEWKNIRVLVVEKQLWTFWAYISAFQELICHTSVKREVC